MGQMRQYCDVIVTSAFPQLTAVSRYRGVSHLC